MHDQVGGCYQAPLCGTIQLETLPADVAAHDLDACAFLDGQVQIVRRWILLGAKND